jgi:hypothetical protein
MSTNSSQSRTIAIRRIPSSSRTLSRPRAAPRATVASRPCCRATHRWRPPYRRFAQCRRQCQCHSLMRAARRITCRIFSVRIRRRFRCKTCCFCGRPRPSQCQSRLSRGETCAVRSRGEVWTRNRVLTWLVSCWLSFLWFIHGFFGFSFSCPAWRAGQSDDVSCFGMRSN